MDSDKTDRISRRAYELWEAAGHPHGQHHEHWLAAERELETDAPPSGAAASDGGATGTAMHEAPAEDAATTATDPHPGMMGDGTEEQNLDQPGHPEARITDDEVQEAFSGKADREA